MRNKFEVMNIKFHGLVCGLVSVPGPHISGPDLEFPLMSNGVLP